MEKNGVTLDDLAAMVMSGFDEVNQKFDEVHEKMDKGFNLLNNRMDKLEGRMDKLENSVEELKKSHEELKELVNGVFRVEIYDLKKRVAVIEEKLGIKI